MKIYKLTYFVSIEYTHLDMLNDQILALGTFLEHHPLPLHDLLDGRKSMEPKALKLKKKIKPEVRLKNFSSIWYMLMYI